MAIPPLPLSDRELPQWAKEAPLSKRQKESDQLVKEAAALVKRLLALHKDGKTNEMALEAAYFAGRFTSYCDRYGVSYE